MSTSWFVARLELARRPVRWAVIGLSVALAGAIVIATVSGARRTASVYDRFRAHNLVASTGVFVEGLTAEQLEKVRALPPIVASAVKYNLPGRVQLGEGQRSEEIVLTGGPGVGVDVDRFTIVSGRAPFAADEIAIDASTAEQAGLDPGDTISFAPYDTRNADGGRTPPVLAAELLRVTGVVATADELARLPGALAGFTAPAYRGGTAAQSATRFLAVRLKGEAGAFDQLQDALIELRRQDPTLPAGTTAVGDSGDNASRVQTALDALAVTLLVIGIAVLLQGAVLLGTVLSRICALQSDDSRRLGAMGATRAQRIRALALPAVIVGLPAVVVGAFGAWGLSSWFPVASARQLETAPGRTVDWLATIGSGAVLVATVIAIAGFAAWQAVRRRDSWRAHAARESRPRASWLPLGSSVATGARFAFGRSGARTPIGITSAGLLAGIAGVAAVFAVSAPLHRIATSPTLYGWNWDVAVKGQLTNADLERSGVADDVIAAAVVRGSIVQLPLGATWSFDMEPVRGSLEFTTLRGRLPIGPGELAAGKVWLRNHDLKVGDVLPAGNGVPAMTVVGEALVPAFDDDAVGGTVIVHGLRPSPDIVPITRTALVLRPGASRSAVLAKLERALPAGSVDARTVPLVPVEVRNLTRTTGMQRVLALLLALSAVSALAHLLMSAIRQRGHEIAILRTLGFTPRQAGWALVWAALGATAVGVVIGTPIGLALGFTVWRILAASIGVAADPVVPWPSLGALIAGSAILALLISWLPARRASRLHPARILRGE